MFVHGRRSRGLSSSFGNGSSVVLLAKEVRIMTASFNTRVGLGKEIAHNVMEVSFRRLNERGFI